MSDTSLAAVSGSGPYFTPVEPNASESPAPDALLCVDKASEGGEGASGAGVDALVRRFGDSARAEGAGGASGYVERAPTESSSCLDEALGAAATCGMLALAGSGTSGVALLLGGAKCAAELSGLVECLENKDAASRP